MSLIHITFCLWQKNYETSIYILSKLYGFLCTISCNKKYMRTKFIELYTDLYNKINFDVSIEDIKDIANKNNFVITHFKIKDNQVRFVGEVKESFISNNVMMLLKLVVEKYPDLDIEFLLSPPDLLPTCFYNLPVFCICNVPSQNIHNPVIYHDCVSTMFENISNTQSNFSEKKKIVFGRYGISGFQGININNWTTYYKIQFALATLMCPELIDIKFLNYTPDSKSWDEFFSPNLKEIMLSMPVYDRVNTSVWTQTISQVFDSKVCIFNDGNSHASIPRILNVIHNDGVVLRIGRNKYQSVLDLIIDSIDEKIVYAHHEKPDNKFYDSIENSLIDDKYRINKNRLAKEYFNLNTMIDLTYETLKLYSVFVKK